MSDEKNPIQEERMDEKVSEIIYTEKVFNKWISIRVIYVVMFFTSVSYSIQLPSLWPYMDTIDKLYTKNLLGWVVASYSIGQLITCPIFSYIAGRTGHFKLILVFSSILAIAGNYLYSIVVDIDGSLYKTVSLIASRVIIGMSGANTAPIRLFLTLATTEEERTRPMATLSSCQAIGFIMGPALQLLFAPLSYPGSFNLPFLRINMYTAPGFFSVFTSIIILVVIVFLFQDNFLRKSKVANYDSLLDQSRESIPPEFFSDYQSATFMLIAFFVCMGTLAVMETNFTQMTMDNFAWSKKDATIRISIILAVVGICSIGVFMGISVLTKKIKEKYLLVLAFICCLLATILLIPMGHEGMPIQYSDLVNATIKSNESLSLDPDEKIGCNFIKQPWCVHVPVLELWQFICSLVLLTLGYPSANVLSYIIFSRLVKPSAQGLWMGLLTASGSLARVVGPIIITALYVRFGLQVTYGVWSAVILVFLCFTPIFLCRMKKIEVFKSFQIDNESNINR